MKKLFLLFILFFAIFQANAQMPEDFTVELMATVQEIPPVITLHWKLVAYDSPVYYIYRKGINDTVWGAAIGYLPAGNNSFHDPYVIVDSAYEYKVVGIGPAITSIGYIYASIKAPAIHNRGTLLLLVDSNFTDSCSAAIATLMDDLSGDGWQLIRHDISRNASDTAVKAVILNDYNNNPNVQAVFILGHLAVPYSGALNPDGHWQHYGAWPADVYYSCLTGNWTDSIVNTDSSIYPANNNVPGDGKWDQTQLPSPSLLQIGRVDFYNMPWFNTAEAPLMESYLARDHAWKMNNLEMSHKGLITDNFGILFGVEPIASNAWRNFPPLVSNDSMLAGPFLYNIDRSSYEWAFACGPGCFTCDQAIGFSDSFIAHPVNAIFVLFFGSYYGDWNVQNNFLRAPLCSNPQALTSCWTGRPNWFFHHMALGVNIGYCARLAQNNTGSVYTPVDTFPNEVHIALMGDPSLRTDYIKPISNLTVTNTFGQPNFLTWTASPDTGVAGYYVYASASQYGYYQRLTPYIIPTTSYNDVSRSRGMNYYMVRPVKLQSTPSGYYYNLGIGVRQPSFTPKVNAVTETTKQIRHISVSPVPAKDELDISLNLASACTANLSILNMDGIKIMTQTLNLNAGVNKTTMNISNLKPGNYLVEISCGQSNAVKRWVKL